MCVPFEEFLGSDNPCLIARSVFKGSTKILLAVTTLWSQLFLKHASE